MSRRGGRRKARRQEPGKAEQEGRQEEGQKAGFLVRLSRRGGKRKARRQVPGKAEQEGRQEEGQEAGTW